MIGPEHHQPFDESAIGDHGALQPRQRLGAKGFLDDVERLRRRLGAFGCIVSRRGCHRRRSPLFRRRLFGAMSMAMLLSDRFRRCAFASGGDWPSARRRLWRRRAPAGSRTDSRTRPCRAPASTASPGTSSSTPLGRPSSALTKPRGSEAALTKSPDAPPRAPKPKRLSATRAACESRAIGFPLSCSTGVYCAMTEHHIRRFEVNPGLIPLSGCRPDHDKSVRNPALAPPRLRRLRHRIHLQPVGAVLVLRGSVSAADADGRQRLPVPGLPAQARIGADVIPSSQGA